jgi:hypothetical protein
MTAAHPALLADVARVCDRAAELYRGHEAEPVVREVRARLSEPLRVAIAGKVKAGKSTLLNALVGDELAPTDAGECTTIVTWYRHYHTYRVELTPREGPTRQVPFSREDGPVRPQLGHYRPEDVERLDIGWPAPALNAITLVDTPGIASLSLDISARSQAFLNPDRDEASPADAVVYLLRHVHATDVRFLEAFHEEEYAQPSPINAIAVLSRADELAVGRIDAMTSAKRVASRLRQDPKLRRLVQTIVPVTGLLAASGAALTQREFDEIRLLAAAPHADFDLVTLSADRFCREDAPVAIDVAERRRLLERMSLFGIRLATALVREGRVTTSSQLANTLVERSGIVDLRRALVSQFGARADVLKARTALDGLANLVAAKPVAGSTDLARDLERIQAGAHQFAEMRALNALRLGVGELRPADVEVLERLLGGEGLAVHDRLGLDASAAPAELRNAAGAAVARWRRLAELSPTRDVADLARTAVRTCEGIFADLAGL